MLRKNSSGGFETTSLKPIVTYFSKHQKFFCVFSKNLINKVFTRKLENGAPCDPGELRSPRHFHRCLKKENKFSFSQLLENGA